ncbi:MAG: acetate--CoA ligase family protein [Alphaproteobacteria bacterium]|nr:acetate--CoA ligase family protein [Alphaproteobacteria bacterium]
MSAPVPSRRAARRANLKRLLSPRHIAFVGGKTMEESIEMLQAAGFPGSIWPVSPKYDAIGGLPAFNSIADLPEGPDAAFLYLPKAINADVLSQLAAHGGGGAVCFAAGYAELGDDGRDEQSALDQAAGDLAVMGPNSTGFLNNLDRTALWPVRDHAPRVMQSGVAIVSSSGGVLFNYSVNQRSVGAAIMIGAGNQAVCDFSDHIDVLVDDERITAIGLFAEDLGYIPAFSAAAAKALDRGTPVVAMKTGVSEVGAMVAQTHSGALAASDDWIDALFERCGVIRVRSLPELDETLKMLTTTAIPKGRRMAVLTNSGGEKALTADAADSKIMELAQPSPETQAKLSAIIPDFATVSNPFDYNAYFAGSGKDVLSEDNPVMLEHCFRTMVDDGYDIAVMLRGARTFPDGSNEAPGPTPTRWAAANQGSGRAVVQCSVLPEHMPADHRAMLISQGVAPLQGLNEAMTAIDGAVRWGEARRGHDDATALPAIPFLAQRGRLWNEADAKAALAAYGLATPAHQIVSPGDAGISADAIGYPVVVKAALPVIAHKAKAGAVALKLTSCDAVEAAVETMRQRLAAAGTPLEMVLVEAMIPDASDELIAGVTFDPQFGHALVFGRGGVDVEAMRDISMALLPLTSRQLAALVAKRGLAKNIAAASIQALHAITAFAWEQRARLVSLDVNPLIVTAAGEVIAVDALIETAD